MQNPLFEGFRQDEIERMLSSISNYSRRVAAKGLVFLQNDSCEECNLLLEGKAYAEMASSSGKFVVIDTMVAPAIFAPASIYAKTPQYPVTVHAIEPCELLVIPKHELTKLLHQNELLMMNFLQIISQQLLFLSAQVKFHALLKLKSKIALYFLTVCGPDSIYVTLPMSQGQLADRFGVTRPSLARVIAELKQDGVLELDNRELQIVDRRKLQQIANE